MLRTERVAIGSCVLLLFILIIWGMTGNCPFRPDNDEWFYVVPALRMAKTCTLNPLWLSHPASTTIYPILFYTHFLNAVCFHGALFSHNATAENVMFDHIFLLCYLPRYMSAFAFIACIPLIYGIAEIVFGKTAAICACFMLAITPQLVYLGQVVRSDCPALFFSLLAIYAILKWVQTSSPKFHVIAAIAIGLAMSSRYNALSLVPLLIAADAKLILRTKTTPEALKTQMLCLVGLITAFITFAITTPYLFLDFDTFRINVANERGDLSLGRDGLSPLGNFQYYWMFGIPDILDQYVPGLAFAGFVIACFGKKRFESLWLASYPLIVVAGTALHPCHDERYLFPTIPIFILFAASAIAQIGSVLSITLQRFGARNIAVALQIVAIVFLVTALKAHALLETCRQNTRSIYPATEALFYNWAKEHIPEGTPICCVGGWFCPHPERYKIKEVMGAPSYFDVVNHGQYVSPDDIAREGFSYFLVNGAWIQAYLNEPQRYAKHCRFYKELWDNSTIVKQFTPQLVGVGTPFEIQQDCPTITLYRYNLKH